VLLYNSFFNFIFYEIFINSICFFLPHMSPIINMELFPYLSFPRQRLLSEGFSEELCSRICVKMGNISFNIYFSFFLFFHCKSSIITITFKYISIQFLFCSISFFSFFNHYKKFCRLQSLDLGHGLANLTTQTLLYNVPLRKPAARCHR